IRPHRRRRCPPTSSGSLSGLAPQSPTDSTSHLTTFGRQGGPATATRGFSGSVGAAAAGTTYQGQECSIRIVANPLESLQPARLTPRLGTSSMLGSRQHSLATDGSLPAAADAHQQSPSESGRPLHRPSSSMSPSPVPALNPCATPRFSRTAAAALFGFVVVFGCRDSNRGPLAGRWPVIESLIICSSSSPSGLASFDRHEHGSRAGGTAGNTR
uniref:Integron gene cassette protein n=1 Tax=Macrostomum lignano TaxID=282301 RepID=A0A1I8FAR1_9PLAT